MDNVDELIEEPMLLGDGGLELQLSGSGINIKTFGQNLEYIYVPIHKYFLISNIKIEGQSNNKIWAIRMVY